jgi:anti-sigma B factor antagonist
MSLGPEQFSIRSDRDARVHRLTPRGDLDIATAPVFGSAFESAHRDAGDDVMMVVDLTELAFIDSSGIRVLLAIAEQARGRLRIVNGSPAVERLFDVTGVRALLPIVAAGDDPLEPLPGAPPGG